MSIIFIVLLHTHFHLPFVLHFLRRMGYVYVDLFMMLSGYGLYYSLTKNGSLKDYFRKRAIRILPTYYSLALVYIVFKCLTSQVLFTDILGVLTTMSFWSGQEMVFSWFAQSLVMFYVLAPLIVKTIKFTDNHWWLVLISFILVLPFITTEKPRLFLAMLRFPAFVSGMCFAKSIKESGNGWMDKYKWRIFIACIIGTFLLCFFKFFFQEYLSNIFGKTYNILFLPAVLMVPGLSVLLSNICNFIKRIKFIVLVNFVEFLGKYTFEIYLVQSLFYMILFHYCPKVASNSNAMWMVIMIIAFAMGCVFGKLIEKIHKRLLLH